MKKLKIPHVPKSERSQLLIGECSELNLYGFIFAIGFICGLFLAAIITYIVLIII